MTTATHRDGPEMDYLWDPTAPPEADVAAVERALAPLRLRPGGLPPLPAAALRGRASRSPWVAGLAAAATVLLAIGGLGAYRWTWPDGRPWSVTQTVAGASVPGRLDVGRELRLGPTDRARVSIARIGTMDVQPGTTITLRSTASNRHRLVMTEGRVRMRVWAPPGAVVIKTPAGDLIDLGCAFRLQVAPDGVARVSVDSGWVQLDNLHGESLVPAGASSAMTSGTAPFAPVFDDATPAFRDGVRGLESGLQVGAALGGSMTFLQDARPKDVLTLLVLARNAPVDVARALLERAASLVRAPAGVTVEAILGGDERQLWHWYDSLDLPPPKSWWRNWRDAFGERP